MGEIIPEHLTSLEQIHEYISDKPWLDSMNDCYINSDCKNKGRQKRIRGEVKNAGQDSDPKRVKVSR